MKATAHGPNCASATHAGHSPLRGRDSQRRGPVSKLLWANLLYVLAVKRGTAGVYLDRPTFKSGTAGAVPRTEISSDAYVGRSVQCIVENGGSDPDAVWHHVYIF